MSSYVITGAARGIGLEFVNQLSADRQNAVFALVRNKNTANKLNELAHERKNVTVLEADVTDAPALERAAGEVSKRTQGRLDYLINNAATTDTNAGFTLDKFPTPEALEKDLSANFKVNTVGVIHATNAFLPLLRAGAIKKVVALTSVLGDLDFTVTAEAPSHPAYSVSKAALNMVVAKYAAQWKSEGFVFLALSPGVASTRVSELSPQEMEEMKLLLKSVAKYAPDFKGPITPEESVKMQLEVINRWTVEETGAFVSHHGDKQWF